MSSSLTPKADMLRVQREARYGHLTERDAKPITNYSGEVVAPPPQPAAKPAKKKAKKK